MIGLMIKVYASILDYVSCICTRWYGQLQLASMMTTFLMFAVTARATDLTVTGGPGGIPYRLECPPGAYLTGFFGGAGAYVDNLGISCSEFDVAAGRLGKVIAVGPKIGGPDRNPNTGAVRRQSQNKSCPAQHLVVGGNFAFLRSDDSPLDEIEFECAPVGDPRHSLPGNVYVNFISPGGMDDTPGLGLALLGGESGYLFCPGDTPSTAEAVIGIQGKAGMHVDSIGYICGPTPQARSTQLEGVLRSPFGLATPVRVEGVAPRRK